MSSNKTMDNKLDKRAISVIMPLVGPVISSGQQSKMQAETIKISIIYIVREHLNKNKLVVSYAMENYIQLRQRQAAKVEFYYNPADWSLSPNK
jgi:hypothetical protein